MNNEEKQNLLKSASILPIEAFVRLLIWLMVLTILGVGVLWVTL